MTEMDEATLKALRASRYKLPGIPVDIGRDAQEAIYTVALNKEDQFLRGANPEHMHHVDRMGQFGEFEITKYPSFVEVRKVWNQGEMTNPAPFHIKPEVKKPAKAPVPPPEESVRKLRQLEPDLTYKYFSEERMHGTMPTGAKRKEWMPKPIPSVSVDTRFLNAAKKKSFATAGTQTGE